jgi:hypothetical protein
MWRSPTTQQKKTKYFKTMLRYGRLLITVIQSSPYILIFRIFFFLVSACTIVTETGPIDSSEEELFETALSSPLNAPSKDYMECYLGVMKFTGHHVDQNQSVMRNYFNSEQNENLNYKVKCEIAEFVCSNGGIANCVIISCAVAVSISINCYICCVCRLKKIPT